MTTCQPFGGYTLDDAEHWTLNRDCVVQEKVDGVRCVLTIRDGKSSGLSRNGLPLGVPDDAPITPDATLDGELANGRFYAFDCLEANGRDLRSLPLRERLAILRGLQLPTWATCVREWDNLADAVAFIRESDGEGIVLKHCGSPYAPDRCGWTRAKRSVTADFYMLSVDVEKQSAEVGEMVKGRMISRGRIFGFNPVEASQAAASVGWQVEVEAMQFTASGKLRHGRFKRFRFDKPAAILGCLVNGSYLHGRTDAVQRAASPLR